MTPAIPRTGQRASFGWPCFALTNQPITLSFDQAPPGRSVLRVALAIDLRSPAVVEARLTGDDQPLGNIDLRFGTVAQVGELALTAEQTRAAAKRGLMIRRADASDPIYLYAPGATAPPFAPHLLESSDAPPLARLLGALRDDDAAMTQFGWMAMCVLDAQIDLGYHTTVDHQLNRYFDDHGPIYEDNGSYPKDGIVTDAERTGIYAALAQRRPQHPGVELVIDFIRKHMRSVAAQDMPRVVAEYNYTVAYPLAVIGKQRGERALIETAVKQLRLARDSLRHDGVLWLRRLPDGSRTYRGWSRGVAWYLQGAARTLRVLADDPGLDDLRDDLADGCRWALAHQRKNGLWGSYLEEPDTAEETSGSAGIAAAVAIAANHGWLEREAIDAARLTLAGLEPFVSGDGLLGGMSQSNKREAGEDVQCSTYRVLGPCATGMAGQLIATLDH